jgi:zinc protease
LSVALALGALSSGCRPALPPDQPLAKPINYKGFFYTFPTGLRLIVYEDPKANEFMLDVSHAVGSRDEDPKQAGIAHLAEHMAFKGRPHGADSPRVWERLLSSGAMFNAFTSDDNTDYWEIGKPDQFNALVALEAERLRDPLANVTTADFESERDVVISEYRERLETNPEGMEVAWLLEASFPGHVYGRETAGSVESLRGITLEDVRAWYKNHYTPEQTTLVVSGPKTSAEVIRFVGATFGQLAKGLPNAPRVAPAPRPAPAFPADPPPDQKMLVRHAPVEKPTLWVSFTTPGIYSPEVPKCFAAAALLNFFLSRRFANDERVEDVSSDFIPFDGAGLVVVRVGLHKAEDANAVFEALNDQLIQFLGDPQSTRFGTIFVRGKLLTDSYLALEQLYAPPIAQYLRATGNPDFVGGWEKQIRDQLANDVNTFSWRYLNRKRAVALLVAPEEKVVLRVTPEAAGRAGVENFGDDQESGSLSATAEQVEALAGKPDLASAERRTLSNGLTVVVARRGNIPLVDVRLLVRAQPLGADGTLALSKLALGASWATLDFSGDLHGPKVGATSMRAEQLDQIVFGAEAPSGNLPHLLADTATWLDSPEPEGNVFEQLKRRQQAAQEVTDHRPRDRAQTLLYQGLFPHHLYGASANADAYAKVESGDVDHWLRATLRPERATLLIVGDIDPGPQLWKSIEDQLGGWKPKDKDASSLAPLAPPELPHARRIILVDRPNATQAEINVGLVAPPGPASQDAALAAASWYLQKHLTKVLREEQGVTYGVRSGSRFLGQADVLLVSTAVDQAVAGHALEVVLGLLSQLKERPLDDGIVQQARWQLARSYSMRFDSVGRANDALTQLQILGRPADYWETYPTALGNLTAAQIQETASHLTLGAEVVTVVGDRTTVMPQLEKAGFNVELALDPVISKPGSKP